MTEIRDDLVRHQFERAREAANWLMWMFLTAALVFTGFMLDGTTMVGHHAFLIGGGITLGIKMGRSLR